ncbi:hypothetical protein GQ44DRAFT_779257 [Phaeosphaeriaceae sp. PMI808]|nr:hypothetical protein GQ44DRAFT_779257 [Phaeosphaeriaceae sp. PMI808]
MSARGARSRKVQQKDVEKREDKKERKLGKSKATEATQEQHDGFADWRATPNVNNARNGLSRTMTASSRATSQSSGTNDSSSRSRSDALRSSVPSEMRSVGGASASISDVSAKGKEKTIFEAKGKETKAPRGRGGGVPIKKTVAPSPTLPNFRAESAISHYPSNRKTWSNFKIWEGGKDGMRLYSGFEFDEFLNTGSVLIYFKEEQIDDDRPLPSLRAELNVLENSGSTMLGQLLHYNRTNDNEDEWALPNSSEAPMTSQQYSNIQPENQRMLGPTLLNRLSPPPFEIDQPYDGISTRAASRLETFSEVDHSRQSNLVPSFQRPIERSTTHEIWFTAPEHIKTAQGQRVHHVAIRNFVALLHGKPIVGADLFDMINTLQLQIEAMYSFDDDPSGMTPRERSIQMITNYLGQHGIDDVRKSIKSAMCLLAWSEQENVRWRQGYLENFVHLAGVMIPELEEVSEFKRLSVVTRRNLGIATKTLQLHVIEAEEKLATFDFSDFWEDSTRLVNNPVFQSYQAFRTFLVKHYTRNYGAWPPANDKTWLNRKIVLALQEDFGSLYDYLVDRDVLWNPREERSTRKWEMAHRKNESFKADVPELGVTDLLVRFDAKFNYSHIPHPYPLLPREIPKAAKEKEKKSIFSSLKKDKNKDTAKDAKAHLQLSILFSDATNIEKLDVNFNGSALIDKFEQFEMTTDLKQATPREARLGRWVLLYGILQALSTLSVDVQGLKHTDGVRYFLCTDLKRCPEWVSNGQTEYLEASQQRSWCWQRGWDPAPTQTAPVELEATPAYEHAPTHHTLEFRNTRAEQEINMQESRAPLNLEKSLDGATLMENDIHRINEKISDLSLSHHTRQPYTQDFQRRRENEKSMQSDFNSWRPRLDSLPHSSYPTPAQPPGDTYHYTSTPTQSLSTSGFDATMQTQHQTRSPLRETVGSVNTDLAGYPFSPEEMQSPVLPVYNETGQTYRESGVGYSASGGVYSGQGFVRENQSRYASSHAENEMDVRIRRSPRRVHESGGWK